MRWDRKKNTYSLSPRDLQVIYQAKVGFEELTCCDGNGTGMPPLWSKMAYAMAVHPEGTSGKYFWKHYREDCQLAAHAQEHYRQTDIPKSGKGVRTLMIPDYLLQHHQRFILRNILNFIPVSRYACAYKKGSGLTDLALPHVGKPVLMHLDLKDFFHSVTRQMVFENLLRETGYPRSVCGMLASFCCCRGHLPQGAATSPALSNICFKECDENIAKLAAAYGLTYTRYSDDIFLSGEIRDADQIREQVEQILEPYGFRLNRNKTRVAKQHCAQRIASITVNEKLQVNRQYRRDLRQELYYLKRFGENAAGAKEADFYQTYLYQVLGKVAFVLYVDPENKEFLEAKRWLTNEFRTYPFRGAPKGYGWQLRYLG